MGVISALFVHSSDGVFYLSSPLIEFLVLLLGFPISNSKAEQPENKHAELPEEEDKKVALEES